MRKQPVLPEIRTVKIIRNRHLEVQHVQETRWRGRSGVHLATKCRKLKIAKVCLTCRF